MFFQVSDHPHERKYLAKRSVCHLKGSWCLRHESAGNRLDLDSCLLQLELMAIFNGITDKRIDPFVFEPVAEIAGVGRIPDGNMHVRDLLLLRVDIDEEVEVAQAPGRMAQCAVVGSSDL